jgi:hypothetical protein
VKVHVRDDASLKEVVMALCAMPEDARRFAIERVTFAGVGVSAAGLAIGPTALGGSSWVVPLWERPGVGGTAAHEVAHALLGHEGRPCRAEDEREAATLAARWGFTGSSADAEGCAARFETALEQGRAWMRARVDEGVVSVECRCGTPCRLYAPAVPGFSAEVGIECAACGWFSVEDLTRLVPCSACGTRATVTWADGATPAVPLARWACTCGETATLRLRVEPPDESPNEMDESEERWAMRQAARSLLRLEGALRRLTAPVVSAEARERGRVSVWLARRRILLAARLLEGDPSGAVLKGLASQVAAAGAGLARDDLAGAADTLVAVAGTLTVLLAAGGTTAVGCKGTG